MINYNSSQVTSIEDFYLHNIIVKRVFGISNHCNMDRLQGNLAWLVDYPCKGSEMQKDFPCHDLISFIKRFDHIKMRYNYFKCPLAIVDFAEVFTLCHLTKMTANFKKLMQHLVF